VNLAPRIESSPGSGRVRRQSLLVSIPRLVPGNEDQDKAIEEVRGAHRGLREELTITKRLMAIAERRSSLEKETNIIRSPMEME
jgi:hypothetical protein